MGSSAEAYLAYGVHIIPEDVGINYDEFDDEFFEDYDFGEWLERSIPEGCSIGYPWGYQYDSDATGVVLYVTDTKLWAMDAQPLVVSPERIFVAQTHAVANTDFFEFCRQHHLTPNWLLWGTYG